MNKKCIWCFKDNKNAKFGKIAHAWPDCLDGKNRPENTCNNVCNTCNEYFGSPKNGLPSIEGSLKELLNISRCKVGRVQFFNNDILLKNKTKYKFSSEFINYSPESNNIPSIKMKKLILKKGFQESLIILAKRAIYKIYLEKNEIYNNNSNNDSYDYIRNFSKDGIGDLPVFYFKRKDNHIFTTHYNWVVNPDNAFEKNIGLTDIEIEDYRRDFVNFSKLHNMTFLFPLDYLYNENSSFFEFEIYTHVFAIAIKQDYMEHLEEYTKASILNKGEYFENPIDIKKWDDVDWSLKELYIPNIAVKLN